jgi:SAM-dependent methyltransferase
VLTVDYERLGVNRGERLLDLGCGGGRHAFAAFRLGARVVALDAQAEEIAKVRNTIGAMVEAAEVPSDEEAGVVQADALRLPFLDSSFDRIIASEVLEHIDEDRTAMSELARVLRPGGTIAVTVPRFGPEAVNWALSREYHDVEGGHVRIYRRSTLVDRLRRAGLKPLDSHHAHALHTPYWWLRCVVGTTRDDHLLVRAYHRVLVWDIVRAPRVTRVAEHLLNPLMGKSLVVYLRKPA